MAVPAPAKVARLLAAGAAALVLLWCVHFRGGLSLGSPANKGLIFNVHPVLMLIGFIILGSEAIMGYKIWPWSHDANKMVHMLLHAVALFLGWLGYMRPSSSTMKVELLISTACIRGLDLELSSCTVYSGYLALQPSSSLVLRQQSGAECSRGTFALGLLSRYWRCLLQSWGSWRSSPSFRLLALAGTALKLCW